MSSKVKEWGRWRNTGESAREGGQGRVFIVQDKEGEIPGKFALKLLKNPKRNARFEREIEAIRRVGKHEHVIQFVDDAAFGKSGDTSFYVMPLADRSLAEEVESGTLSLNDSFRRFEQICLGVEHLHAHKILHRDLKPENVLIFGDDAKVSDLGLCLIDDLPRITPTSEAVGPRFYMAPELEDGRSLEVNASADIYSLGKILYFLLSKGQVFPREDWRSPKRRLDKLLDDGRFRLFDVIFSATINQDPRHRFSSVRELREAFSLKVVEFEGHARSRLLRKLGGLRADELSLCANVNNLDSAELTEAVADLAKQGGGVGENLILELTRRLERAFVSEFLVVFRASKANLSAQALQVVAERLISDQGFFSAVMGEELGVELARLALQNEKADAARVLATHGFLWLRRYKDVLLLVLRKYARLDEKARSNLLLECSFAEGEDILPALIEISRQPNLSRLEVTPLVAALVAQGRALAIDRLIEMGRQLSTEDEFRAFGQGLALRHIHPESLRKLKEADWGNRILANGLELKVLMLKTLDFVARRESENEGSSPEGKDEHEEGGD